MSILLQTVLYIYFFTYLIFTLGCANKLTRNPVPADNSLDAIVLDFPAIRAVGSKLNPELQKDFIESVKIKNELYYPPSRPECEVSDEILALSGGGSNGAFGAGFLNGWSESGTRPVFKLVTGVSTGALIAPFAFLGSEYNITIKEIYTGIKTDDLIKNRGIKAIWNESLAEVTPLIDLLEQYIDQDLLDKVADAHSKGRRLYIGTTNLDAGKFVIWNMGAIASSGHPDALLLFRKVLLASSSMPLFFPPVLIDVDVDGKTYDEMHVDGGVMAQVFFFGFVHDIAEIDKNLELTDESKCVDIYIIRNGKININHEQTKRNIKTIAMRSLTVMINASSINDLFRIYHTSTEGNIGFNYVSVPDNFVNIANEPFDQEEMIKLYQLGYQTALSANAWNKELPFGNKSKN